MAARLKAGSQITGRGREEGINHSLVQFQLLLLEQKMLPLCGSLLRLSGVETLPPHGQRLVLHTLPDTSENIGPSTNGYKHLLSTYYVC